VIGLKRKRLGATTKKLLKKRLRKLPAAFNLDRDLLLGESKGENRRRSNHLRSARP